ncbi:cell division protein FtsA [bacterium]|nr:MAG: cell division protein FtsA [bacterium]
MKARAKTLVGLDIGTTKICAVVAEQTADGLQIIGCGTHPATGLRKGVVVNIESTVQSIKKAIEEAELTSGREIKHVYAGIAGGHIQAFNSHGVIALKEQEVSLAEKKRVIDAARAVAIPMDREVLHIIPQNFIIDDQDGIDDPVGMCGVRLEAHVHIVTGAVAAAQNLVKCCERAGLSVVDIILGPLASAEAVITPDEKELGVVVVDMGGGTTDIVVIGQGSVKHTSVLTIGGNHVTSDISHGLRTPMAEAEKIKIKHACALVSKVGKDETIEVPGAGGRRPRILNRRILAEIVEPRVEEIFSLIRQELQNKGFEETAVSGVVLCGGGSMLDGTVELAEQVFGLPVRRGEPRELEGLSDQMKDPSFATGVGLVKHAYESREDDGSPVINESDDKLFSRITQKMKGWFQQFFLGGEE